PAVQDVHGVVRAKGRRALLRKHLRDGRFAHADRAGEADDDHGVSPSAARRRTRAFAASGLIPNQSSKERTPWWINMPRPSTVDTPRSRAARSKPVSRGRYTMSATIAPARTFATGHSIESSPLMLSVVACTMRSAAPKPRSRSSQHRLLPFGIEAAAA